MQRWLSDGRVRTVVLVVLTIAISVWWVQGAEARRASGACETWMRHQGLMRGVLTETDEALERAADADDGRLLRHFNDSDAVLGWLRGWERADVEIRDELDDEDPAGQTFRHVVDGVIVMRLALEAEDIEGAQSWLPELQARFQNADDLCGRVT